MRHPPGITYTLTPAWAQSLRSLAQTLNARLMLGVNLEADSPLLAQTEADAFMTAFGKRYIDAMDIGNEPPLYPGIPWYRTEGRRLIPWYDDTGTPVFRPRSELGSDDVRRRLCPDPPRAAQRAPRRTRHPAGRVGVSDTMASALWAAAALFSVAQDGVDGVNLHTYAGLSNGLFDFSDTARGWTGDVHPIYYGALLFGRAPPAGSRLLHVSLHGPPTLHGWATSGPGRVRHVVLLNDSTTNGAAVVVRAPRAVLGMRPGQLQRLTAPGVSAIDAITLGGRGFGPATSSGVLGAPVSDPVRARGGAWRVTVPPASAAVLTFSIR